MVDTLEYEEIKFPVSKNGFSKIKMKNKSIKVVSKFFVTKGFLQCFSSKNKLVERKKVCLKINSEQAVKLEKGTIDFHKKYQDLIPCSFSYKLVCVDNKFNKPIILYKGKNAANKFIKTIFKEQEYYKKVMKKQFNKNLIEKKEENFWSSDICWIRETLIENEKMRDHCHIVG